MTKRIAALAVGAAAALSFALPAAPAAATCISYDTTPVNCAQEALDGTIPEDCIWYETYWICPPVV